MPHYILIGLSVAGLLSPFTILISVALLRIWRAQSVLLQSHAGFQLLVTEKLLGIEMELKNVLRIKILEHELECKNEREREREREREVA